LDQARVFPHARRASARGAARDAAPHPGAMGQPASHNMCCTVRDKDSLERKANDLSGYSAGANIGFSVEQVPISLQRPRFVTFSPLWQVSGGLPFKRRMAVASSSVVHVYRLEDPEGVDASSNGLASMWLEHKLELPLHLTVTAMIFGERGDEGGARRSQATLVVATRTGEGAPVRSHTIKVWQCDSSGASMSPASSRSSVAGGASEPNLWKWDNALAELKEHTSPVRFLSLSTAYVVSGDDDGWCRIWDKPRHYECYKVARVVGEEGRLADITTDRHFAYTVGQQELAVRVWAVPDLRFVMVIDMQGPIQGLLAKRPASARIAALEAQQRSPSEGLEMPPPRPFPPRRRQGDDAEAEGNPGAMFSTPRGLDLPSSLPSAVQTPMTTPMPTPRLEGPGAQISLLRRPLSRWSGAQPSKSVREGCPPKGLLFAAGQLGTGTGAEAQRADVSFLMVWCLKAEPKCHAIELAHDRRITCISYGPYDNGPLVTADARGVFWVWDFAPKLVSTQVVDPGCFGVQSPAMAVDPGNRAMYAILGGGDQRMFVWRQQHNIAKVAAD